MNKYLSPESSPSSVKALLEGSHHNGASPRLSMSSERGSNNVHFYYTRSFYILNFILAVLFMAGLECTVLFSMSHVFSAFPYVIAVLLVIFAVIVIPFISQKILNGIIDANTISLISIKILVLKMYRNCAFSLVFFCFAGAPAQFDVTIYNYCVAGMAILIHLVVGYMLFVRIGEVIDAYNRDDADAEAEIFQEETGYALTVEYHDDITASV